MTARRLVEPTSDGRFRLNLSTDERAVLASLVAQLRELLVAEQDMGADHDPNLRRLYPTAYPDDEEQSRDYEELVGDDLLAGRLDALDTVEGTLEVDSLDEAGLVAWMRSMNDLRLVLGTRLDVDEDPDDVDPDDPDAAAYAVYGYLGWLLEHIVESLSGDSEALDN